MSDTALAKILSRLAEAEAAIAKVEHTVNVISDSHRPPDHKPALMDDRRPRDPRRIRAGLTRGPPPLDDDDRFLPTTETAQRYATTTRSIDRWAADPKLNFPKPHIHQRPQILVAARIAPLGPRAHPRIAVKPAPVASRKCAAPRGHSHEEDHRARQGV